LIKQQL